MADRVIRTLATLGVERALVFFGHDGLDELTVTTTSTVYELEHGEIRVYDVDPVDLGIPRAEAGALAGGDAAGNAAGGAPGVRRRVRSDPRHRDPELGRRARSSPTRFPISEPESSKLAP